MKPTALLLLTGLCCFTGCMPSELAPGLATVSSNQLGTPPPISAARTSFSPGDGKLTGNVNFVGRELLAFNSNSGLEANLAFVTYPAAAVEIFHLDRTHIYVTEGLVKKCNQEQLAAVLANELGKIVAERQAVAPYLDSRDLQPQPSDNSTAGWAELVRYDGQQRNRKLRMPDPRLLAQTFLEKAGYSKGSLELVQPLLQEAGLHHDVERLLKGLPPESGWQP